MEQAHSPGGTSFGSSVGARRGVPTGNTVGVTPARVAPSTWLNLVCLDAPAVSVAWLWLFAGTFHAPVTPINSAVLFLTAWLIYLGDRLADSYSLRGGGPRSLRHEFCLNHRRLWMGMLGMIAVIDGWLIWCKTSAATFLGGAVVGALAVTYLMLNYSSRGAWPRLPLKELAIGVLFAAGTLVALLPAFPQATGSLMFSAVAFACLCTLNCISIAFWERELDETQGKVSFATRYPGLDAHLRKTLIVFGLISAVMAIGNREVAPIFGCVGVSAFLLALLESFRGRIERDQRTALADLVLLTPLLALSLANA